MSKNAPPTQNKIVVTRPQDRFLDQEHGFERGWGVSRDVCGSSNLSMAHGVLPSNVEATAHQHPFETAIYIIKGTALVHFGDDLENSVAIEAGDFLFIPPFLTHKPINQSNVPLEYVVSRNAAEELAEEHPG